MQQPVLSYDYTRMVKFREYLNSINTYIGLIAGRPISGINTKVGMFFNGHPIGVITQITNKLYISLVTGEPIG